MFQFLAVLKVIHKAHKTANLLNFFNKSMGEVASAQRERNYMS